MSMSIHKVVATDMTDTRRPSVTVYCNGWASDRRGFLCHGVTKVVGSTVQSTAEGNRVAHERAEEWNAYHAGTVNPMHFSRPDWHIKVTKAPAWMQVT